MLKQIDPSKTVQSLSRHGSTESRADREFKQFVAQRTRMLFGCFRKGDAADPDVFVSAAASVLARYPEEVVRRVTDPVDGLPSKCQWLPTIAEVKSACEAEMAPLYRAQKRQQIAEEGRRMIAPPSDAPEIRERAVDRWERQKAASGLKAKVSTEEERIAAEKRVGELYRECQNGLPKISEQALALYHAKAKDTAA